MVSYNILSVKGSEGYLMKRIKDEDIEKLIDQVVENLPEVFSKLFVRKIDFKVTDEAKEEAATMIKELLVAMGKIEQKRKEETDPSKVVLFFFRTMDSFIHSAIPEVPQEQHFVDWFVSFYANTIKPPSELSFLQKTQFDHYQALLKNLVQRIHNLGRMGKANQFLAQVARSDDAQVIAQAFFTRLLNYYQYLEKRRVRTTAKTIEKHIQIYGELAGHFEKYLSLILGLIEILRKDQIPIYNELSKRSLAKKEWELRKDKEYSDLISPFNRTIRNAISHAKYVLDPIKKEVEFMDLREKVSVSYQDFESQVKELSSLVLALSQLRVISMLVLYQGFKRFLSHVNQSEEP